METFKQKLHQFRSNTKAQALAVVLLFGFMGLGYLVLTQAATSSGPIVGVGSKCLDNYANLKRENNRIQLYTCNKTDAQVWKVKENRTIVNANGFCLTAKGRSERALVTLNKCSGTDRQKWVVNSLNNTIVSAASGLCLDDQWRKTADENPIWMYKCNDTVAQVWKPTTSTAPSPSITTFTTSSVNVTTGQSSTLNWATENTTTCSVTPGGPTNVIATSWKTPALAPAGVKTFTLTCKNAVGATISKTVSVTAKDAVVPAPAPARPVTNTGTLFGACPTNPGGESLAAATTVLTKWGGKPTVRQFNGGNITWNATPARTSVHRSYKPAATVTDAQIDNLIRTADADAAKNGVTHILTFWHESDNDGLSSAQLTARIKLINRLHERKVALGVKNIKTSVIWTGGFFASYGSQAVRDQWNGVKADLVGLDADGVHTTQDRSPNATDYTTNYDDEVANVKKFIATNKANGFTGWTVPEFGTRRSTYFDPSGTKLAAWMTKWGNYFAEQGAEHVEWYDYGQPTFDIAVVGSPEFNAWKAMIAKNK